MPRSCNLVCAACKEETWCSDATTCIDLDDGTERIVGHPGEVRPIEEWTGRSFHEVLDADRLHYARLLVCATCGVADRYRDDDHPALRRPAPHQTADEVEAEHVQAQEELRERNPEQAATWETSKIGPSTNGSGRPTATRKSLTSDTDRRNLATPKKR